MSDHENWVSLPLAVAIVKAAIGSSQGPAQRRLIASCESGDVRARWTAHHSRTQPPIHRRDWIGADIDWANFRIVKADGAGMAGVDFSEDDLNAWVAAQGASKSPAGPLSKDQAAKRAVAACFPGGVPADILNPSLCRALGEWLKINLPNMADISDTTMLRAAGRKK